MIDFIVEGKPVGKERPRVGTRGTYTPQATADYEAKVAWAAKARHPGLRPKAGAWCLAVTAVFGDNRRRDLDNVVKTVMDALEGVVWVNDSSVVKIKASKSVVKGQWRTMVTAWEEE